MIRKIYRMVKSYISPPRVGDVYYGDPFDHIVGKPTEHVLHGLRDKSGDPLYGVVLSDHAYRFTIESDAMPYYICKAEVLVTPMGSNVMEWRARTQSRRIWKHRFLDMIWTGMLEKL